ncbi:hypothetical protein A8B98_02025 [Hymenobacter sp. UV11]|nr:hypothetical protein A8B98_02025 [Hymenobacter sp. UV11]
MFSISSFGLRLGLGLAVLLGSAGLALATTLLLFLATYDGTAAHVEWEVATETDLHGFDLSRKTPADSDFQPLATLTPTGRLRYTFVDSCLVQGRSGLLPGPVLYRLTLRGPGPDQTYTTTVAGTMSVVQRSWGSIKLMFH